MEEQDNDQKEFEATEQRRQQARRDGEVAQSKELNAFAVIIGLLVAVYTLKHVSGGDIMSEFTAILYHADSLSADTFSGTGGQIRQLLAGIVLSFGILLMIIVATVLIAIIVQQSITFSVKKIKPDIQKISPSGNLKKKYGAQGLSEFAKDTAKMLFAGIIAVYFLYGFASDFYGSSALQPGRLADFAFDQVISLMIAFGAFQLALALVDLPLQSHLLANRLKMSREEVKRETKQSEGDPQLKQARRQKAAKTSKVAMLKSVETATVLMVNPTHYAVALRWSPESTQAPVCVAKGVDHIAARMREISAIHGVPIYSDPPNTRSIYQLVEVDREILPEHFAAVAAAIQFVERVRENM